MATVNTLDSMPTGNEANGQFGPIIKPEREKRIGTECEKTLIHEF
jgi:hypothetical protein